MPRSVSLPKRAWPRLPFELEHRPEACLGSVVALLEKVQPVRIVSTETAMRSRSPIRRASSEDLHVHQARFVAQACGCEDAGDVDTRDQPPQFVEALDALQHLTAESNGLLGLAAGCRDQGQEEEGVRADVVAGLGEAERLTRGSLGGVQVTDHELGIGEQAEQFCPRALGHVAVLEQLCEPLSAPRCRRRGISSTCAAAVPLEPPPRGSRP